MYTVAVQRDFIARHFLIGGDWGEENEPHAHHYVVEARLDGRKLDTHGYLVDICDIESVLEDQVSYYRDKMLNELSEFKGLNPSVEHLARILCQNIAGYIQNRNLTAVTVKIWENKLAWAQFQKEF
jgi:6-pyruvoyltetrahydropterin/6-carboxytetrahydropterin synthase